MDYEFRTCKLEMDYEAYIKFLLQHHHELKLPYSFAVNLSFISSPLLFGKAILVWSDEPYEIVGAVGFVYGTGANDYEDQHVCQVEVAFLQRKQRNTSLFLHGLQGMLREIKLSNPKVKQIQFWSPVDDKELEGLFSKFQSLPGSTRTIINNLVLNTVLFDELEVYCDRFSKYLNKSADRIYWKLSEDCWIC